MKNPAPAASSRIVPSKARSSSPSSLPIEPVAPDSNQCWVLVFGGAPPADAELQAAFKKMLRTGAQIAHDPTGHVAFVPLNAGGWEIEKFAFPSGWSPFTAVAAAAASKTLRESPVGDQLALGEKCLSE